MLNKKMGILGMSLAAALAVAACSENRANRNAPASGESSAVKKGNSGTETEAQPAAQPAAYTVSDVRAILQGLQSAEGKALYVDEAALTQAARDLFKGSNTKGNALEFRLIPNVYSYLTTEVMIAVDKPLFQGEAAVKAALPFVAVENRLPLAKTVSAYKVLAALKLADKPAVTHEEAFVSAKKAGAMATLYVPPFAKTLSVLADLKIVDANKVSTPALVSGDRVVKAALAIASVAGYGESEAASLAAAAVAFNTATPAEGVVAELQKLVNQVDVLLGASLDIEAALK